MVARLSAQIALLGFSAAIVAGLWAGNTPSTVLSRALTIMVIALFVGQVVAYACKLVLREYLQQKKTRIDTEHFERIKAMSSAKLDEGAESELTG